MDAFGLCRSIRVWPVIPGRHLHAIGVESARQRSADQSQSDDADPLYHSNSLRAFCAVCQSDVEAEESNRTPPSGSIHESTGGFGRSLRG